MKIIYLYSEDLFQSKLMYLKYCNSGTDFDLAPEIYVDAVWIVTVTFEQWLSEINSK